MEKSKLKEFFNLDTWQPIKCTYCLSPNIKKEPTTEVYGVTWESDVFCGDCRTTITTWCDGTYQPPAVVPEDPIVPMNSGEES